MALPDLPANVVFEQQGQFDGNQKTNKQPEGVYQTQRGPKRREERDTGAPVPGPVRYREDYSE